MYSQKQQDLQNLLGAIYSAVLFLGVTNGTSVQSVVSIERTVFYRERAAGMYSPLPYAFAQVSRQITPWNPSFTRFTFKPNTRWLFINPISSAGGSRDNLCSSANFYVCRSALHNDWIRDESCEIPLVLLFHLHKFHLLHSVRNDVHRAYPRSPNWCHYSIFLHQLLELVLRFPHS